MAFVLEKCSDKVFAQLSLPDRLHSDERLNPIGQSLVFDLGRRSALMLHPFHHADYPDQCVSFFTEGEQFNGQILSFGAGMPQRVYINVDLDADPAVLRREATCSLSVQVRRVPLRGQGRPA